MRISHAPFDEFGQDDEATWIDTLGGFIRVALALAAITGAFGLLSGWFGGIGFDGADLFSILGGGR